MKIGIDFDNTIADFSSVFSQVASELGLLQDCGGYSKKDIREHLRMTPDGELKWQRLQGRVYGREMYRAVFSPGLQNFLLRLKRRGIKVVIASHKSEFGHFDEEQIPLRGAAVEWMRENRLLGEQGLGISLEDIYFSSTREEKIETIARLNCDVFIDDLIEIFEEKNFPENITRVHYGSSLKEKGCVDLIAQSWDDISAFLLGKEDEEDVKCYVEFMLSRKVDDCKVIKGRGNSRIYRVEFDSCAYAAKLYPSSSISNDYRIIAETKACRFLNENQIKNVRVLEASSKPMNLSLFQWIEGASVGRISTDNLLQAIEFVRELNSLSHLPSARLLPMAAEACLCRKELERQIDMRVNLLNKEATDNLTLAEFIQYEFLPVKELVTKFAAESDTDIENGVLPEHYQTLSPSDFGFHNALRTKDGLLTWFDFEYFGWDDPVKLISDFVWHPGFTLTGKQKSDWINQTLKLFSTDPNIRNRFRTSFPLYGLRWVLILLNEFLPSKWHQRQQALGENNNAREKILAAQLNKARTMLKLLKQESLDIISSVERQIVS